MIMAPVSVPCQSHTATTPAAAPAVADDANASADGHANKKRASIHYPDDSTAAKRMSLHYGHRSRSHSESRATPPTSSSTSTPIVVPETSQENKDEEEEGASSLSESVVSLPPPAASSSSSAAVAEGAQATGGGAAATKPSSSLLQTTCTPMEDESCSSPQGSKSNVQEMATDQQQQQQEPEQQPDLELMKQLSSFLRDQGNASAMDRDESAMESRMSMDKNASSKPSSSAGPTEDESAICDLGTSFLMC
ncbi:hypothetical protein B0O80DRAFT_216299 [Mortierella sp. GBAus27b]|nr:hypothetical protein B0O80DRAFT_216299 [Mortierella sp. GBAus27b]